MVTLSLNSEAHLCAFRLFAGAIRTRTPLGGKVYRISRLSWITWQSSRKTRECPLFLGQHQGDCMNEIFLTMVGYPICKTVSSLLERAFFDLFPPLFLSYFTLILPERNSKQGSSSPNASGLFDEFNSCNRPVSTLIKYLQVCAKWQNLFLIKIKSQK